MARQIRQIIASFLMLVATLIVLIAALPVLAQLPQPIQPIGLLPTVQSAIATHQTAKAPKAPVPLAEYLNVRRIEGASFSYDESLVAYLSDEGGRPDLWVQPVGGGKARQMTKVKGFVE